MTGTFKRVMTVASGSAAAQAILVVAAPVVGWLYGPASLGAFGVLAAFVRVGGVLGSGAYQLAIPLEADEDTAMGLAVIGAILGVIVGGGAGVGASILCAVRGDQLVSGSPGYWGAWVGVCVLMAVWWQLLTGWNNRRGAYTTISGSRVVRALGSTVLQLGWGSLSPSTTGLMVGRGAGDAAASVWLALRGGFRARHFLSVLLKPRRWARAGWRYRRFPLFAAPQAMISTASVELPSVLLPLWFGAAEMGNYVMAYRVVTLPSAVLGEALRLVLLKELGDSLREGGGVARRVARQTGRLAAVGAVVIVPSVTVVGWLLPGVLGDEWRIAGSCARWLLPWAAMLIVSSPTIAALYAVQRQDVLLLYNIVALVLRGAAVVGGGYAWGFVGAVATLACVSVAAVIGLIVWGWAVLRTEETPARTA